MMPPPFFISVPPDVIWDRFVSQNRTREVWVPRMPMVPEDVARYIREVVALDDQEKETRL